MGTLLLIEDDRNIQKLIEEIVPKEDLKIFRTPQGRSAEIRGGESPEAGGASRLEEAVRHYLAERMSDGKTGNIHGDVIEKVERTLIGLVLEEEKGNQVRASKRLGINRNTLRKKMKDLQIIMRMVTR